MNTAGLNDGQASAALAQSISRQGFLISANEIFWASAIVFMLLFIVVWFAKPPFGQARAGGEH